MYIGTQPYSGIRARHTYTATADQTSFSGAGAENVTLTYADELYIDVYQNGVKLSPADYTATSGTTVVLAQGASVNDIVEVIKFDAFSVADTVSAKDGGGFGGNVSVTGNLTFTGDLIATTAGTSNFTAGVNAGNSIASGGNYNTVVGDEAGTAITTGDSNVFVGYQSGDAATAASSNTAVGESSLGTNILSSKNVAVGNAALFAHNLGSVGDGHNTAVGFYAGVSVTTGTLNTFIGGLAGDSVTEGLNNVLLGYEAGGSITTGDNNVCIGYQAAVGQFSTTDNQLFIARGAAGAGNAAVWIQGNANGACIQGNNNSAWTTASDERIKKDIVDSPNGLAKIDALQVRNFNYRTEEEITAEGLTGCDAVGLQTGVIAQELELVLPNAVTETETGLKRVSTDPIFWAMLKSIQELSAQVTALTARITTLEGE